MTAINEVLFGTQVSPATQALAWVLEQEAWNQAHPGEVKTRGEFSSAATFKPSLGCWALHNLAWWHFGGAHRVVRLAAKRLRRMGAVADPALRGQLALIGSSLQVIGEQGLDPWEAAVWQVASASHKAWRERHAKAA